MNPNKLRELAEKATPGKWKEKCHDMYEYSIPGVCGYIEEGYDARYIAAANPETILKLLEERDELRAALVELNRYSKSMHSRGEHPNVMAVMMETKDAIQASDERWGES